MRTQEGGIFRTRGEGGNLSNTKRRGKSFKHGKGKIFQTREGENLSNTRRGKSFKHREKGKSLEHKEKGEILNIEYTQKGGGAGFQQQGEGVCFLNKSRSGKSFVLSLEWVQARHYS